ncbi:substrate-binding domain-containing protein [uncultured Alistipes sp.]|uniref:substrate-binding domain-containing protein n=1 Tax=uncultured Alistipes sp. TaxID=538949 RepID=UPI00266C61AE|nr:substrate-binding domain-containing protein [uncultured Alistipes sp.]
MARILFLTDFSEAYARNLLLGIARYAHAVGQAWSLCRLPLSIRDKFGIEAVIDLAQKMRAEAVIGQFYNTDNVELFARNGIITIAQDFKARFTTIPNITGPHFLAGKMGAEYFVKKGFRHFAFYGTRDVVWSDERMQGFRETVRATNPSFTFSALCKNTQNALWDYDTNQLVTWLQSLPKPVAIMACDDNHAYHITEACQQGEGGVGCASPTTSRCWAWTTTRRSAASRCRTSRRSTRTSSRAATTSPS